VILKIFPTHGDVADRTDRLGGKARSFGGKIFGFIEAAGGDKAGGVRRAGMRGKEGAR